MTISARTTARLDIANTLAVEINTTHKTERTGDVLSPVTVRMTDARFLLDGDVFYDARLLPEYRLEESTGAASPPNPGELRLPNGTGIKGGTAPNTFSCSFSNDRDSAGRTLDALRDYVWPGAEIIVRRGAEHDGSGNAHTLDEYAEVFYGRVKAVDLGVDEIRVDATSPEGWNADRPLVREAFIGLGYGIVLDNTALPATEAYLSGAAGAWVPAAGKYAWSMTLTFLALPSAVVGCGAFTLFNLGDRRAAVKINEADDSVTVTHNDGGGFDSTTFGTFVLTGELVETPIHIGGQYDGTDLLLYVNGVLVDTATPTRDPSSATTLQIGRQDDDVNLGSFILYEAWFSDDELDPDPVLADIAMRSRQAGPLEYDRTTQGDIRRLYKMLEGGVSPAVTVTADLVYDDDELDLTLFGPAAWSDSEEGDKPTVNVRPRGESKPFLGLGRLFNAPATFRSRAGVDDPRAIYQWAPWDEEITGARVDGSRLSVFFEEVAVVRMRKDIGPGLESMIESPELARFVFAQILSGGDQLRPGSGLEVAGSASNDGVYHVKRIEGRRFVFVQEVFPAEDLVSVATITVPQLSLTADVTNLGDGSMATRKLYAGAITLDVEREAGQTSTLEASLIFLSNAARRPEGTDIDDVSFTDDHDVTLVGPTEDLLLPWSFGIAGGGDIDFRTAETDLLQSYGAWSTDTARVDIGEDPEVILVEGIRAGHFVVPDLANVPPELAFTEADLDESSVVELATLAPAASLTVRYRRNMTPLDQRSLSGLAIPPAEKLELSEDWSSHEVFRDNGISVDYPGARHVVWEVSMYEVEHAIRIGQRMADFLKTPRTWYRFRLDLVRPEAILIGDQISQTSKRFKVDGAGDAVPVPLLVLGKTSEITLRGADLVAVA